MWKNIHLTENFHTASGACDKYEVCFKDIAPADNFPEKMKVSKVSPLPLSDLEEKEAAQDEVVVFTIIQL